MKSTLNRLAAGFIAVAFLIPNPAMAQNEDDEGVHIRAKRVVIEVDDEGHVLVDGKRVSNGDGTLVLRVEPDNGEVEVEAIEPRQHQMAFGRAPHREHKGIYFRRGEGLHPYIDDFDFDFEMPHVPDVAPLLERFRVEVGDPLRESMEEHREVAELERRSRDLANRARQAEGADRRELEEDLRTQLNEIFDKKVELREERVASLEKKLAAEREELERRRAAREEVVERRLRTLLGEDDTLDW